MNRLLSRRHSINGFSLMEILLIVVVLGVIAGLAIPSYLRTVRQAESLEAVEHLGAIRLAQTAYYTGHGTFAESLERLPDSPSLDLSISPRKFDYTVERANENQFLVLATSKEPVPWANLPYKVSIDEAGNVLYYWPESGGSAASGTGHSGSSTTSGGSGASQGHTGSGGSSAGGGANSSGGSSSGSGSQGGSNSGSGSVTFTHTPPTAFDYIARGDDLWSSWPDANVINIGGTEGTALLAAVFDLVANSGASAVTDDLFSKGIEISFGDPSQFAGNNPIAFLDPNGIDDFPGPPVPPPVIVFNPFYINEDAGVLAAILVHEATHFQEYLDGTLAEFYAGNITNTDVEFTAWWNEAVYWAEVRDDFLPIDTPLEEQLELAYQTALQGEGALRDLITQIYM